MARRSSFVVEPPVVEKQRIWSFQQMTIFDYFEHGAGHLVVRARAGTGKTTTIIEGVNRVPETAILVCAFNKRIADVLNTRLDNPHAAARTLHSVGYAAIRSH